MRAWWFFPATAVITIVVCFEAKLQMDFELCLAFILFFAVVATSIVQALLHFEFNDTIYPSVELQQQQRKKWLKLNARDRRGMTNLHKTRVETIIKTSSFSMHFQFRRFYHSFRSSRLVSSSCWIFFRFLSYCQFERCLWFFCRVFFSTNFCLWIINTLHGMFISLSSIQRITNMYALYIHRCSFMIKYGSSGSHISSSRSACLEYRAVVLVHQSHHRLLSAFMYF